MVRDTLLGFPSRTLPYRYHKSYHFIDRLRAGKPQWFPGSFYVLQDSELNLQNIHPNYL